jgi:hypothetical protein
MVYWVVFAEVDGEVTQGIEDGHVELVVLLGAETARSELGDKRRTVEGGIMSASLT